MVRPLKPLLVSSLLLLGAGVAFADKVVLHPGDSVTLDGTSYACGDPNATGVQLGIGDKVTVNGLDIKCRERKGGAVAPAPEPAPTATVDVTSSVDLNCVSYLAQVAAGVKGGEVGRWADACRGFEVGKQCTVTSSTNDDNCFSYLTQVVGGAFSGADAGRAHGSCKQVQATCPAPANAVESRINLNCVSQLAQATAGGLDSHAVIGAVQQCRDHAVGQCVVVGGAPDLNCVSYAAQVAGGGIKTGDAASVARACRTLELRCP